MYSWAKSAYCTVAAVSIFLLNKKNVLYESHFYNKFMLLKFVCDVMCVFTTSNLCKAKLPYLVIVC